MARKQCYYIKEMGLPWKTYTKGSWREMICCDLCGDEEIVWSDGYIHLCKEHYDELKAQGHIKEVE